MLQNKKLKQLIQTSTSALILSTLLTTTNIAYGASNTRTNTDPNVNGFQTEQPDPNIITDTTDTLTVATVDDSLLNTQEDDNNTEANVSLPTLAFEEYGPRKNISVGETTTTKLAIYNIGQVNANELYIKYTTPDTLIQTSASCTAENSTCETYDNYTVLRVTLQPSDYCTLSITSTAVKPGNISGSVSWGQAEATETPAVTYDGTLDTTCDIQVNKINISNAQVTCNNATYDGYAKKFSGTVSYNGIQLVENTDYTVQVSNNTNVGKAKVIITGKGNYTGTKEATFDITPASILNAAVTMNNSYAYTGKNITFTPTVKVNDKTLSANTDFTTSWSNNTNPGKATVTISGKGNYTGSFSKNYTITYPINKAQVTVSNGGTYDGKAKTPNVKVIALNKTLKLNQDYKLSYTNNTNAGTATVKITGCGIYTGQVSKNFTIAKAPAKITASAISIVWNADANIKASSSSKGKLTYKSNNTNLITVNTAGKVHSKKPGKTTVTITSAATQNYNAATLNLNVTVNKRANPMTMTAKTLTVKLAKVKKAAQTVAPIAIKSAQGKVTFTKTKGSSVLSINKNNGKIQVKKGAKKGTYKATIKIVANGNTNYNPKTIAKEITVKVA